MESNCTRIQTNKKHTVISVSIAPKTVWNTLQWSHNERHGISNYQPHDCLLNHLFRRRWKTTSKFRVTGLCEGNSPGPVNSPHKGPVTRKMFPIDDVIMKRSDLAKYYATLSWFETLVIDQGQFSVPNRRNPFFGAPGNRYYICTNMISGLRLKWHRAKWNIVAFPYMFIGVMTFYWD